MNNNDELLLNDLKDFLTGMGELNLIDVANRNRYLGFRDALTRLMAENVDLNKLAKIVCPVKVKIMPKIDDHAKSYPSS